MIINAAYPRGNPVLMAGGLRTLFPDRFGSGTNSAWNLAMAITQGGLSPRYAFGQLGREQQNKLAREGLAVNAGLTRERLRESALERAAQLRASTAERAAQRQFLGREAALNRGLRREKMTQEERRAERVAQTQLQIANQQALARMFSRGGRQQQKPAQVKRRPFKLPNDAALQLWSHLLQKSGGDALKATVAYKRIMDRLEESGGGMQPAQPGEDMAAPAVQKPKKPRTLLDIFGSTSVMDMLKGAGQYAPGFVPPSTLANVGRQIWNALPSRPEQKPLGEYLYPKYWAWVKRQRALQQAQEQ